MRPAMGLQATGAGGVRARALKPLRRPGFRWRRDRR